VTDIEDVREAKRRKVVERAKELLAGSFDESVMDSTKILEEVRESIRVEDITEYHGLPAGPNIADSDAIIVVEGRSDVLTLLGYGIKNAIGVEGTNVSDDVADLTEERTVTAFLDGDRGGELILRELAQVGDVDYVAFAPEGRSVEDLDRHDVLTALRNKTPYGDVVEAETLPIDESGGEDVRPQDPDGPVAAGDDGDGAGDPEEASTGPTGGETTDGETGDPPADPADDRTETPLETASDASTLRGHVRAVIETGTGTARLLDSEFDTLSSVATDETFDAVVDADEVPYAVVVDGEVNQRLLDVAAQRGVHHVIGRSHGETVKKPVDVRVRTVDQFPTTDVPSTAD
jgi:DNA primase